MSIRVLRTKIHRAVVTDADLHYEGSITIDRELMDEAGMYEYERVQVLDIDNGERLETYIIEGEPGSRTICLNGAAARLVSPGDRVIILAYNYVEEDEVDSVEPTVLHVDEDNNPID